MRSIRLSLVVYFLALVTIALGAVSILADRVTREALAAKQASALDRLQAELHTRYQTTRAEVDQRLLTRAEILADVIGREWGGGAPGELAAIGIGPCWYAYLVLPSWLDRRPMIRIRFAEDIMVQQQKAAEPYFFQIYDERGETRHRSKEMRNAGFTLDPATQVELSRPSSATASWAPKWSFDDTSLPGMGRLRRVTMKAPLPLSTRRRGRIPQSDAALRWVFVQVASGTANRDMVLASYRADFDREAAALAEETALSLASVRRNLLWIGLATLLASMVGAVSLIALGLAPLRRLSQAVRGVSEKDIRLPIDEAALPRELRPIRHHLVQTLALLRRAFAREKQAVADISHELRTPLAALLTTLEVGLKKSRSPAEYAALLGDCQAIGQQMSELVERLLALARLDAGADAVRPKEVDVACLAEECLRLLRPIAEARHLAIALHAEGPMMIETDPDKLREILTNLLHNAVEYNRPGGRIDLTLHRENGRVRVAVRDTGIGIALANQPRIFERFYRVDGSRHADGMHAGLGLAIVRAYTKLLGGTIALDSVEGQGTTIRLELPGTLTGKP